MVTKGGAVHLPGETAPDHTAPPPSLASSSLSPDQPGDRPTPLEEHLRRWAGQVADPELPFLTLTDLGVLTDVTIDPAGAVTVSLTPTYTGCPAVEAMADDIRRTLRAHGVQDARVTTVLSPPWTTDRITEEGRRKLAEAGIAPPRPTGRTSHCPAGATPSGTSTSPGPVPVDLAVRCPQCGSTRTTLLSRFSSTACKALRRCEECREPFDHFKEL
ncbi:1,2-phenylacetyl-CoA epoxidase subunit PaaD [Streptomyces sp. NPDC059740]|uniref:1,2-phenylacetyl-CoA epoxidase subunit PaaD n=1 Tax=Streptomyces sp. NPDC059740 TaxID=3346926 RepID=UPI00366236F0